MSASAQTYVLKASGPVPVACSTKKPAPENSPLTTLLCIVEVMCTCAKTDKMITTKEKKERKRKRKRAAIPLK